MKISFLDPIVPESGILVLAVSSKELDAFQSQVDSAIGGQITRIINASDFKFDKGCIARIPYPQGINVSDLFVVAIDSKKDWSSLDFEKLGGKIWSSFGKSQQKNASVYLPELSPLVKKGIETKNNTCENAAACVANGLLLKSWHFSKYFTKKEESDFCAVKNVQILGQNSEQAKAIFECKKAVTEGVFLTRHLVSEPPNVIYPETLAEQAEKLEKMGLKVEILGKKDLKELGFNALLGVAQGSGNEPKVVIMQWNGGNKDDTPVAFIGKGVTFDSGGISLKPPLDMDMMKGDMAGSAAVIGLMKALAGRKAKANVIGVVGLVENMPDGKAQRPADIVKSLSGQTIEVLNTDAEGRLVLADALWYTQKRFKPKMMIDIATLTGAIVVSLGSHHAGLFSNDDTLADGLLKAGNVTGEKLWRLPMSDSYDKEIDSVVADVKNIGQGAGGGSITAAQFLQRFVNKTKWAHVDIAGTYWDKKDKDLSQPGATAIGVRLFDEWVRQNIEK